jgi:hypothetical protein
MVRSALSAWYHLLRLVISLAGLAGSVLLVPRTMTARGLLERLKRIVDSQVKTLEDAGKHGMEGKPEKGLISG